MNKLTPAAIIDRLAGYTCKECSEDADHDCGSPTVLIGDVLAKMADKPAKDNSGVVRNDSVLRNRLVELWQPFGFTTSLNEILSGEMYDPQEHGCDGFMSTNVQALYEFLASIFNEIE